MAARTPVVALIAAAMLAAAVWPAGTQGQPPAAPAARPADPSRIEFEVAQSFDAKYQGDSAGHLGRATGLEKRQPQVALGDAVYRGQQQIGVVTGLGFSRTHGTLEVEFQPLAGTRISVGDAVWLALDGGRR